jgi:hypothetical protein
VQVAQIMTRASSKTFGLGSFALLAIAASLPFCLPNAPLKAQAVATADRKMAFDVASVRPSKDDAPFKQNIALDASDAFPPTGGLFTRILD